MAYTISYLPTASSSVKARHYFVADLAADLPVIAPAVDGDIAYAKDTDSFYSFDGATWSLPPASVAWGAITGTLSDQLDLQAALDAKQDATELPQADLTPTANLSVVAGYGAVVPGEYTLESGIELTLESASELAII